MRSTYQRFVARARAASARGGGSEMGPTSLVSVVTAHPHCRVLFLQTIKHLFGQNARAAHNSSSNRVFQFRHHPDLPFFLLSKRASRKNDRSTWRLLRSSPSFLSFIDSLRNLT